MPHYVVESPCGCCGGQVDCGCECEPPDIICVTLQDTTGVATVFEGQSGEFVRTHRCCIWEGEVLGATNPECNFFNGSLAAVGDPCRFIHVGVAASKGWRVCDCPNFVYDGGTYDYEGCGGGGVSSDAGPASIFQCDGDTFTTASAVRGGEGPIYLCVADGKLIGGTMKYVVTPGSCLDEEEDFAGGGSEGKSHRISVSASGPGTELKSIFKELGFKSSSACGCESLAKQMNTWGVEGCRERGDQIIAKMRANQAKAGWFVKVRAAALAVASGLAWKLDVNDPAVGLLDEAIRRAESGSPTRPE